MEADIGEDENPHIDSDFDAGVDAGAPADGHVDEWTPVADERRGWIPGAVVASLVVVAVAGLFVAFRNDQTSTYDAAAEPTLTVAAPTTAAVAVTPAPAAVPVAPTPLPVVGTPPGQDRDDEPAGEDEADNQDNEDDDDERDRSSTSPPVEVGGISGPQAALDALADDPGVSDVSDLVPIGSGSYAFVVVDGNGRLLRWDGGTWTEESAVNPPGSIRSLRTVDVTGDGTPDFVVTLSGAQQPGGVYSRATFEFDWLPFNTTTGQVDFVDNLSVQFGDIHSEVIDGSGQTISVTWRWTGRQFETG